MNHTVRKIYLNFFNKITYFLGKQAVDVNLSENSHARLQLDELEIRATAKNQIVLIVRTLRESQAHKTQKSFENLIKS